MLNKKIPPKTVISPNLLPPDAKEELNYLTIGDTIKKVVFILSALTVFFWMVGGILLWQINREEKSIALKLENEVDSKKLWELNKMNDQFKELRALTSKVDKSLQKEYRFSELLTELSSITPQGVIVTSFETSLTQPGWVRIKGAAHNRDAFLAFKKHLEESKFYEKVESPSSNLVSPERVSFELNVLIKDWKPAWGADLKKKSSTPTTESEEAKD